jgi:hypothetical protein
LYLLNLIFFINICGDKYPWHEPIIESTNIKI